MQQIWEAAEEQPIPEDAVRDRIFDRILTRIDQPLGKMKRRRFGAWHVAASLAFLVMVGAVLYFTKGSDSIRTAYGEQRSIELNDGSQLRLNANSQVRYAPSWAKSQVRQVWLQGEAFFKIVPAESKQPFQVKTNHVLVEVLGTSFNVNSSGAGTTVFLEEGSIKLSLTHMDTTLLMKPGDFVIYDHQRNLLRHKSNESARLHTSWKEGVLFFDRVELLEVIHKIEQIYGVEFQLENAEDGHRILAFPLPIDSWETTLAMLDKTLSDLRIYYENRIYIIRRDNK